MEIVLLYFYLRDHRVFLASFYIIRTTFHDVLSVLITVALSARLKRLKFEPRWGYTDEFRTKTSRSEWLQNSWLKKANSCSCVV